MPNTISRGFFRCISPASITSANEMVSFRSRATNASFLRQTAKHPYAHALHEAVFLFLVIRGYLGGQVALTDGRYKGVRCYQKTAQLQKCRQMAFASCSARLALRACQPDTRPAAVHRS